MKTVKEKIESDDMALVREGLYELTSSEMVDTIDVGILKRIIRSAEAEIRERALFVFGIKLKRCDLCDEFVNVFISELPENWDVIAAAASSIRVCGCEINMEIVSERIFYLLYTDEIRFNIGQDLFSWLLQILGRISDREFIDRTRKFQPLELSEVLELRRELNM